MNAENLSIRMALDVPFIPKQLLASRAPSTGSLLLFDATSTLWSSKDDGCTWSKLAKLPFGQGSEQVRRAESMAGGW